MKKTLLIAALFACSTLAARAGTVTLSGAGAVTTGNSFDLLVQVTGVFAGLDPDDVLLAYGFNVAVADSSVVSYTGETASPLATDITAQLNGVPTVAGIFFGLAPGDFTEPLTLATLHFTALSHGATNVTISSNLALDNQGLLYLLAPLASINASTNVAVQAPAPEPATVALGFALLGSFAIARHRRR